jgi:flagellar basal-body rod modification protein FlgD
MCTRHASSREKEFTVINATTGLASSGAAASAQSSNAARTPDTGALRAGMSGLDRNAFLQLLVTQLEHQNPLKPQEDGEFIAQLAQFSSLEQLTEIQQTLSQMSVAMGVINLKGDRS